MLLFSIVIPPQLNRLFNYEIQELVWVLNTTNFRIKNLVRSVGIDFNDKKVWSPDFSNRFVYRKRLIREKWKWNIVLVFEDLNFKGGIAGANPDNFNLILDIRSIIYTLIKFVDQWGLFLTIWAIHAEYLKYQDLSLYLG